MDIQKLVSDFMTPLDVNMGILYSLGIKLWLFTYFVQVLVLNISKATWASTGQV